MGERPSSGQPEEGTEPYRPARQSKWRRLLYYLAVAAVLVYCAVLLVARISTREKNVAMARRETTTTMVSTAAPALTDSAANVSTRTLTSLQSDDSTLSSASASSLRQGRGGKRALQALHRV
ncbi:uncharacterized protein [Dermacentor albipictus]|uniref:uncharacterized protein n=1 Tax=Dermacentor albipictus TaxID=60249 RepID=UPI0031FC1D90